MLGGLAMLLLWGSTAAGWGAESAGLIDAIRPPAYLVSSRGRETVLDPKLDVGRVLLSGEKIRCGPRGEMRLRLDRGTRVIGAGASFTLPVVRVEAAGATLQAIRTFYRRAGRERGGALALCAPAPGSVARPGTLKLRWVSQPEIRSVSLSLRTASGRLLWRQGGISAASGELVSAEAREALGKHRAARGEADLVQELTDPSGAHAEGEFSLLGTVEEKALDRELAVWSREPHDSPMGYVGRASVWSKHRMLAEVAEEYEAGLRVLPQSRALLQAAVDAHLETGNSRRVDELRKRLEAVGASSEPCAP
jgi:hypothetical protein